MAKVIRKMNLYTLKNRLDKRNPYHFEVIGGIEMAIVEEKRRRLSNMSPHTSNVGEAFRKALLVKAVTA